MRRPYRERLRIILDELGAGLAGRGRGPQRDDPPRQPGAARDRPGARRSSAARTRSSRDLTTDADAVLGDLADNRKDVGRWVTEARDAPRASAERRAGHRAPASSSCRPSCAELRPTMAELGATADAQRRAAPTSTRRPPARDASSPTWPVHRRLAREPALAGPAADTGRPRGQGGPAAVAELDRPREKAPELAKNLEIILSDLDDRRRAVEKDPRSPGGQGYTGFEALLQYVFDQSMAINIFDANGYMLKVNLFRSGVLRLPERRLAEGKEKEDPASSSAASPASARTSRASCSRTRPTRRRATPATKRPRKKRKTSAKTRPRRTRRRRAGPTRRGQPRPQRRSASRSRICRGGTELPDRPGARCPPSGPDVPQRARRPDRPTCQRSATSASTQALLDYLLGP